MNSRLPFDNLEQIKEIVFVNLNMILIAFRISAVIKLVPLRFFL